MISSTKSAKTFVPRMISTVLAGVLAVSSVPMPAAAFASTSLQSSSISASEGASSFSITYDGNTGAGNMDSQSVYVSGIDEAPVSSRVSECKYSLDGYVFDGWTLSPIAPEGQVEDSVAADKILPGQEISDGKVLTATGSEIDLLSLTSENNDKSETTNKHNNDIVLYASWAAAPSPDSKSVTSSPEMEEILADRNNIVNAEPYSGSDAELAAVPEISPSLFAEMSEYNAKGCPTYAEPVYDSSTHPVLADDENIPALLTLDLSGNTGRAAAGDNPEQPNGSKIESLSVEWITKDSYLDNSASRLSLRYSSTADTSITFRLSAAFSGQHNYLPGEVELTVPRQIYRNRSGALIGNISCGDVPIAPNTRAPWAYVSYPDRIVITNTRTLSAATSVWFDLSYTNISPTAVNGNINEYVSEPVIAYASIVGDNNEVLTRTSNRIDSTLDTSARVTSAQVRNVGVYDTYPSSFPASLRPANPENYTYVSWFSWGVPTGAQMFDTDMSCSIASGNPQGAFLLGVKTPTGSVVSGSGTSMSSPAARSSFANAAQQTWYSYIYMAVPKSSLPTGATHTFTCSVEYTLKSKDDREVSKASASAVKNLTPVKWVIPTGHFIITKTGGHTYGTALNKLLNGQDTEVTFEVHTRAFGAPWTYQDKNANGIIDEGELGVYSYSMDSYDDTIKIDHAKTDEQPSEFSFSKIDVYALKISQYERTGTMYEGKVGYVNRTSTSSLTLNVDVKISNGPWTRAAYLTWNGRSWSGSAAMTGVSTKGSVVYFPNNVTDYRTSFTTTNGAVEYDVRPTVKLKASAKNINRVKTLFANSDAPDTIVQNEVWMEAFDHNKRLLATNDYGAQDNIQGASMAAQLTKTVSAISDSNKQRTALKYSAKVNLQTNIDELDMYKQILSMSKNMSFETGGTFYDLLPVGVKADLETLSVSSSDSIVSRRLVPNWRGSNRDMMIVEVKHAPSYKMTSTLGRRGYSDTVTLDFMAYYSFDSAKNVASRLTNVISYGSNSDNIGTITGYRGEPDNPLYGNNTMSKQAVRGVESLMTGLDTAGRKTNSFLYASATTSVVSPSWAMSSLDKTVSVSGTEDYSDGLSDSEPVNVREGGEYVYKLSFATPAQDTTSKQLVFYDNLEKFVPDNKQDAGDVTWKGTFKRVDTTALSVLGAAPVVYYSTRDDLVLDDTDNRSDMDLSRTDIWSNTAPKDLSLVKAIAIDASKKKDGTDFVLPNGFTALAYVYMDAPMGAQVDPDDPASVYDKTLGDGVEEGKNGGAHAYNNVSCLLVNIDKNGTEGPLQLVRKDYTKVGILPYQINVSKIFDDDDDRDGLRPESCEFELISGDNEVVERFILNAENSWATTMHVPFRYDYSIREVGGNGSYEFSYTMRSSANGETTTFSCTNKHVPEKIPLTINKFWEGDSENASNRPSSVSVEVYDSTGKKVTTLTLYEKDGWTTTIQVPKYYDHGKELKYFVKEVSSPNFYKLGSIEGTSITNTYYPFGDLVIEKRISSATEASSNQEFTFQLDILDNEGEPVAGEWAYEKSTGETGVISNGKTFSLRGGETFTVKDISCYDTYLVQEVDIPNGWKSIGRPSMTGKVKTHTPATCSFENIYSTEGQVGISLEKTLVGKQLKSGRFQFELTDAQGNVLSRASNRADGSVSFSALRYRNSDHGKNYTYYISEVQGGVPAYSYDSKVYRVDVAISDNGDGTMSTRYTVYECDASKNVLSQISSGVDSSISGLAFSNAYHASGSTFIEAKKQLDGRELKEGEFEFGLYDESGNLIQTLRNDAEGNIVSNPIEFDENDIEKEHKYVLKEIPGTDDTVQYSTQEFTYTIIAHDEEDGTLSFTNTVNESPVFKNTLKPGTLRVEKETTNGDTQALHNFKVRLSGEPSSDITFEYDNSNEFPKVAFAVYSADDQSLSFYKRSSNKVPQIGDKFEGKTATYVYTGIEEQKYETDREVPWGSMNNPGYHYSIKTVYVRDEITPISTAYWFHYFRNLTEIVGLDLLDTSNVTDMSYMFFRCEDLVIDFSQLDTSSVTNMSYMLSYCSIPSEEIAKLDTSNVTNMRGMFSDYSMFSDYKITSLDLSTLNTSKVTDMSYMFSDCSSLTSLNLKEFDTSNVTNMSYMFAGCKITSDILNSLDTSHVSDMSYMFSKYKGDSLTPTFDTGNVTNMRGMFANSVSLKSVDLSNLDTSNVTDMSELFYSYTGNKSLISISFGNINTSRVTNMSRMFSRCEKLEYLDINNIDTGNVTDMHEMFSNCLSLTTLNVDNFNTSNVTDMSKMFYSCASLPQLDLSFFDTSNVRDMSGLFNYCLKLQSINVSNFNTSNVVDMSDMFAQCKVLSNCDLSKLNTSKVTNMSGMFRETRVSSLDITKLDTSNVRDMSKMFSQCSGLPSCDLSKLNTSKVTNMSFMFYRADVSSLDLGNFDTSNVRDMSSMFSQCTGLSNCDLSELNTSKVTSMKEMFNNCYFSALNNIDKLDMSNVTDMSGMFAYAKGTSANLNLNTSNVTNMNNMFYGCTQLQTLNIEAFNTSNVTSMYQMFYNCSALSSIYVSDLWKTENITLSTDMFYKCTSLVGGAGTKFTASYIDATYSDVTYARIDDPANGKPGYLTYKPTPNTVSAQSQSLASSNLPLFGENTILGTADTQHDQELTVDTSSSIEENSDPDPAETPLFNPLSAVGDYLFGDATPSANAAEVSDSDSDNDIDENDTESSSPDNIPAGADVITNGRTDGLYALMNESNNDGIAVLADGEDIVPWTTFGTCEWMIDADYNMTIRPLDGISGEMPGKLSHTYWPWNPYSEQLQKVTIKRNVSVVGPANYMFAFCSSLESVDLSGFDTSKITKMENMFLHCRSLSTVDLSEFNTSNVTSMGYMFSTCRSLSALDLSSFDTSAAIDISAMFLGCSSLTTLDLSNFDTSNVTDIGGLFYGCSSLESVDLSSFDTHNVTSMGTMFRDCSSLESVDLSNFDTSNVTSMSYMFLGCSSLKSLDVSRFNTNNVTTNKIKGMFFDCYRLSRIVLSSDFNISNMGYLVYFPSDPSSKYSDYPITGKWVSYDAEQGGTYFPLELVKAITSAGEDTSAYAGTWVWEHQPSLRYDKNNEQATGNVPSIVSFGSGIVVANNPFDLPHYVFKCWNTESDGTGTDYLPGKWIFNPGTTTTENPYVTLYAQWEYHPSLRYNSNHELSIGTMPDTIFSSDLIVEESAFTVEQYRFTHWNTKPDGSGIDYYPGDTISDPGTTTPDSPYVDLYAQWEEAFPIIGYDANGASGSMPNDKVTDTYVVPQCSFYRPGYAFVSWNTQQNGKGTTYRPGEKIDQELDLPASGSSVSLTLYAQWEEQKVDFDSTTNTYSFSLRGGQSMTFNNVPAGTTYTVYEETQNGWVPIEISGDMGSIASLSTSVAHFLNERRERFAQTVVPGNKLLDGKPAAGFVFELVENDSVVATTTSDENGLFEFKMEYTEPGNHSYIVREKIPENADKGGIVYDEHVAEVTINVTENADGTLNLYSTLPRDPNGNDKPLDPDSLGVSKVVGKYYRVSDTAMSWTVASYPVQILKGNGGAYDTTFDGWSKYIVSPGSVDGTWICTTVVPGTDNVSLRNIAIPNGSYMIVSYEKEGDAQAADPLGIEVGDVLSFSGGLNISENANGLGDISILKPFSQPDGYDVYDKISVYRTSSTAINNESFPLQVLSGKSVTYPINAQNCLDATNAPPRSLSVMGPYRAGQNYIDPISNTKSGNYGWSRALFEPVDVNGTTCYRFVRYYSTSSTGDDVKPVINIDGAIVIVYHPTTYSTALFSEGDVISFDFDLKCVARPLTGTGQAWPSNAPVIGNMLFAPKISGSDLPEWNKYRISPSEEHPSCFEIDEKYDADEKLTSLNLPADDKVIAVPSWDNTFDEHKEDALYSFDCPLDLEQSSPDGIGHVYYMAATEEAPPEEEEPAPAIGLSFKNTSKPGSLTVSKTVNGTTDSVSPDHEFTFKVTLNEGLEDEQVEVLKIKAGEQASIDDIPAGTKYKVEETDLPLGYSQASLSNASGVVSGGAHIEVLADNSYKSHGEALISGEKSLIGTELAGDDFSFELVRQSDGKQVATTRNDMGGSFGFVVEANGTGSNFNETYLVREVADEVLGRPDLKDKVVYDGRTWTVNVAWTDNKAGALIPTVSYSLNEQDTPENAEVAHFENSMKTGTLHIEKVMDFLSEEMKEFEFEFELTLTGEDGQVYEPISWKRSDGDETEESYSDHVVRLKAGQSIDMEIPAGADYRITERPLDKIALISVSNDSGTIEAGETTVSIFKNGYILPPYNASGEASIPVSKTLLNGTLLDGQFTFAMLTPDGQEYRGYNDENGNVSFPTLMFDESDSDKEFLYQIFELAGEEGRIIYDMAIRNVTVVPRDNGDGTMSCQMTVFVDNNGEEVETGEVSFTNKALLDNEVILPGSGLNGAVVMLILLGLLLFWGGVYQYKRGNRKKDSLNS